MGYYTYYTVKCDHPGLLAMLADETDMLWEIDGDTATPDHGDVKWYEHEDDLARLTAKARGALFTLDAVGEDGARWRVYALNGETQREDAVVTFGECRLGANNTEDNES